VGDLVFGVVVDVLRHVRVENADRRGVRLVARASRHLAVLHAAELVVLLPEIGLEGFERRGEAQKRLVSFRQRAARGRGRQAAE
jgi:hypothetical protein